MFWDRTQTRARVLDAALALFVERGYEGTTITAIERQVGLAAGTGSFYRHFRSKDDVFAACVEKFAADFIEQFLPELEAVRAIEDPHERLVRDLRLHLDAFGTFEPIERMLRAESARFPELVDRLTGALQLEAWNLAWDETRLPGIVMAALIGYGNLRGLSGGPYGVIPPDEFVEALANVLLDSGVELPERRPTKHVRKRPRGARRSTR
jgi:AcrR family transcriptional regulator